MKIHFGFFEVYGDYEHPCYGASETACGLSSETVLENFTVDNWEDVSCKLCLRLKEKITQAEKEDENVIAQQMGDMAKFWQTLEDLKK
jgi:hypothetical protein